MSARAGITAQTIEQLGLAELFTCVAALIDVARERRIPIAARGSAVSALTGHLLGFSPIDPLAHGLYFEHFVSRARLDVRVLADHLQAFLSWPEAVHPPARELSDRLR